jgi:transposase-like protein
MKRCRICNVPLNKDNWYLSLEEKNSCICKRCNTNKGNEWKRKHPQTSREYSKQYYKNHPKYNVPWCRENRIKIRAEMIQAYGGKCSKCGINNPLLLDIDHIHNDGSEQRKQGMWGWRLYRWLRKYEYPKDNFQLLCKNCNWLKEMERRRK